MNYLSSINESVKYCLNDFTQCIQSVPTNVVSTIFQEAMSENPINRIVKGTVFVAGGSYLFFKYKVVNKKGIKTAIAVTSGLFVAYGLYNIFLGISELRSDQTSVNKFISKVDMISPELKLPAESMPAKCMSAKPAESMPAEKLPASIEDNYSDKELFLTRCPDCLTKKKLFMKSNQKPIQDALERFKTCPFAETLWKKLNLENRVCLVQLPPPEVKTGNTYFLADAITINSKLSPDDKLYWISYEANNLIQKEEVLKQWDEAMNGKFSREAYTKKVEEIEFTTSLRNYELIKKCFDHGYWADVKDKPDLLQDRLLTDLSFEKWWNLIKNTDHAQDIRLRWDAGIKDNFCKIHPTAKECLS